MSPSLKCRCGKAKTKSWHLVCPQCWALVPKALQDKVYHFYLTAAGGDDHVAAVRECFEALRKNRAAKPASPPDFKLSLCQHPHGMPCLAHKAIIEGGEEGAALACPTCAPHVERTRLLLNKTKLVQSGFGGVSKDGVIVDRRIDATATPIAENAFMNIPKPLKP